MDTAGIIAAADALHQAQASRLPIAPLTSHDALSEGDAYRVQLHNIERRLRDRAAIRGSFGKEE